MATLTVPDEVLRQAGLVSARPSLSSPAGCLMQEGSAYGLLRNWPAWIATAWKMRYWNGTSRSTVRPPKTWHRIWQTSTVWGFEP